MPFTASDIVPLTEARANLSELADQVKAGSEKIITKNGESYVALIDAERLDYYHRLERERIHLLLIDDAEKGLIDVEAGRTRDARAALADLKRDTQNANSARAHVDPWLCQKATIKVTANFESNLASIDIILVRPAKLRDAFMQLLQDLGNSDQ